MADNTRFDMTGVSLELALSVAYSASGRMAFGYDIDPEHGFILYWTDAENCIKFPTKLDFDEVLPLVAKWLDQIGYPAKPSFDGHCERGFRIYNEDWGRVRGEWEAFAAITPVWLIYGK